ncbi:hypothetical protein C8A03DRAFT_36681 [Achaetomium macrosporum]|uniref:Uncharacterized protein n=1 Tax=Achaetomium macrosporum TaxID=79813 RepID=A0AAN7C5R9_9PEZI|nr:hypothetical protein C8A03DRAFT_36681 [Achaetomium macrosporum]
MAGGDSTDPGEPSCVVSLNKLSPNNLHYRNADISIDIITGLHRIGTKAFSYNEGAARLYEPPGFDLECQLREPI